MKFVTSFTIILTMFLINACTKGSDNPPAPTTSVAEVTSTVAPPSSTEAPPTTLAPTTTINLPPNCPQPGVGSYKCYDWGSCKGFFYSRAEAIAVLNEKDAGGCNKLNEEVVKGGFGPCSQCIGWVTNKSLMMKASAKELSFEEILKARDGKSRIEK